ncbi:hypothetical protein Bca101_021180 [Brassica carinata]
MGVVEGLNLKLTPPSLRRRMISRSLVIVVFFAFSLVSLLRSLNKGETQHHHNPCKVDECAKGSLMLVWLLTRQKALAFEHRKLVSEVQFEDASFGFVFSVDVVVDTVSASLLVYEMERLLKPGGTGAMLVVVTSVSSVSSLLKNSSVVHVASLSEHLLVVFRKNREDSHKLFNNRPYIGLLEPLLEEKRSDFERRIHYLPEFIDLSSKKRLVYIDIGAADHLTNWFFPSYPIEKTAFNTYFVHHNASVLPSYVKSPGVTFIYHPGLAAKASVGEQEETFVEEDNDSFDFLAWFKETASFADFVVLKMNTSDAELEFLSELIKTGEICSVDELFINCTGYRDCTSVIKSLRNRGVFVHQWWED